MNPVRCTLYIVRLRGGFLHAEERRVEFNGPGIFDENLNDSPPHVRFDLVHHLHRLDDADHGGRGDPRAHPDEGLGFRRRGRVEGAGGRALDRNQIFSRFGRLCVAGDRGSIRTISVFNRIV